MSAKNEEIIHAIRNAFADVRRGEGISLREADAIDDYASDEQRKSARALDTDNHWWEIPPDLIERFSSALFFMDAEGFRYYIPAFMSHALRSYEHGSLSVNAVLSSLFPLNAEASARYAMLDDGQRKCIARFLWFISTEAKSKRDTGSEVYDATRALEEFWYPYLPQSG